MVGNYIAHYIAILLILYSKAYSVFSYSSCAIIHIQICDIFVDPVEERKKFSEIVDFSFFIWSTLQKNLYQSLRIMKK